jgi:hypothetical protein
MGDHDGVARAIGSFRGVSWFLDNHLSRYQDGREREDYLRFYMGTLGISRRADLTPVYAMIFHRLNAMGADWQYHVPELGLIELGSPRDDAVSPAEQYSVSESAVAELTAQQPPAEVEQFRAQLQEMNARARDKAMDQPAPATVRAYRQVYRRDPRGWPPA